MIQIKFFLILLVFLLNFPDKGNSLVCYSCSASLGHGSACENITNHLSDISHHECFYNEAVCATYKIEYGSDVMIYRSCKEAGVCFALSKKLNSQYNRVLDCETCNNEDLCNLAGLLSSSFLLSFISVCILFFH